MLLNLKEKILLYLQIANVVDTADNHIPEMVSAIPVEMLYTVAPAPGTSDKALVCPYVVHYLTYKCNRYRSR